jgi:hypothetical protein
MRSSMKVMPPVFFFLENVIAITGISAWMIHTSFGITRLFVHGVSAFSRHFFQCLIMCCIPEL